MVRLPQGKGWVFSGKMVVKRWKVYKRLLFPCGVVTEWCSMTHEPKSPNSKELFGEKQYLYYVNNIVNIMIITEIMNC